MNKNIKLVITLFIAVVLASVAGYFYLQNQPVATQWVTYVSKNLGVQFSYPKDYPTTYPSVPSGIEETSTQIQLLHLMGYSLGIYKVDTNESLDDWAKSQTKNYINYIQSKTTFNGLPAYYFKNNIVAQTPMDIYVIKRGNSLYQIYFATEGTEATQCSKCDTEHLKSYRDYAEKFRSYDKVILERILSSFSFTADSQSDNYVKAVNILQVVPEVKIIQQAVIKNGRNTSFSSAGGENGDIVTVLLFEGGFPDKISKRVDTFMVNVKTDEIQVYSGAAVTNKNISLEEWKKTVKDRFQ